jgi:hypothetical protein
MSSEDSRFRRIARPSELSINPSGILKHRHERTTPPPSPQVPAEAQGRKISATWRRSTRAARGGGEGGRTGSTEGSGAWEAAGRQRRRAAALSRCRVFPGQGKSPIGQPRKAQRSPPWERTAHGLILGLFFLFFL